MRLFPAGSSLAAAGAIVGLLAPDAWAIAPEANPRPAAAAPWYELGGQVTGIDQTMFPFRSPYQGTNSLRSSLPADNAFSHTYTLYLGVRPLPGVEFYVDPEMARGAGVSSALGLAGFTNGDVIRNPTLDQNPYVARAFGRFWWPLSPETAPVSPAENLIGGALPTSRLQLTLGKLGTNDIFDQNAYASNTRSQFQNWSLINNTAYDYAADTRGYSIGGALEWIHPTWTLRYGFFQMPAVANGSDLDGDWLKAQGQQLEWELHPATPGYLPGVVRLLGYMNRARMGSYGATLASTAQNAVPDITASRQAGALKLGLGASVDLPLGDDGNTGLFARLGWNDDRTEAFAYTEAQVSMSAGGQLSGAAWKRPGDRLAAAFAVNGLGSEHAAYLARGGLGFLLGDGQLSYGPETLLEAYYAYQISDAVTATLDYQGIANPGYNLDRGPVSVLSLRLHLEK